MHHTVDGAGCRTPKAALAAALAELPRLHREIEYVLVPVVTSRGERVSGSKNFGLAFNEKASAVRTAMVGVLASWAGAVTRLVETAPPERAVGPLAAFLLRHLDVLVDHPAVADLAEELDRLVADARRVTRPPGERSRITIGRCPRPGCGSVVESRVGDGGGDRSGGGDGDGGGDVRCGSGHTWPAREWLALRRSLAANGAAPAFEGRTLPTRLAAQAAGVPEATVRKWASRGKLTRHGSPSRAEYDVAELAALAAG
ncbi:hypothetical protein [Streptomyces sp. R35]|uniref:HTH merR-type domain-containing protein n=1 Tax=Streptomyces sp. R35 TaxID=3238630 RepID=A0AB39S9G1_9ACTN